MTNTNWMVNVKLTDGTRRRYITDTLTDATEYMNSFEDQTQIKKFTVGKTMYIATFEPYVY